MISVLISIVILGILSVALMTLSDQVSSVVMRANVAADTLNVARYIQTIMNDPLLCSTALRFNGSAITYDGSTIASIDTINLNEGGSSTAAIQVGQPLNAHSNIAISSITLTPKTSGLLGSAVQINGVSYNTYIADLTLAFKAADGAPPVMGQSLRPIILTVSVAARSAAPYTVDACPQVTPALNTWECNQVIDPSKNCSPTPPTNKTKCDQLYYVTGFDSDGVPICQCQWACGAGA